MKALGIAYVNGATEQIATVEDALVDIGNGARGASAQSVKASVGEAFIALRIARMELKQLRRMLKKEAMR